MNSICVLGTTLCRCLKKCEIIVTISSIQFKVPCVQRVSYLCVRCAVNVEMMINDGYDSYVVR